MAASPNLRTINDLENLVIAIIEESGKRMRESSPVYYVKSDADNEMLGWAPHTEIQQIPLGLWRIGAIGDGNCLLHSLLTAMSPSYRRQNKTNRQLIADRWREILVVRVEELKDLADIFYPEIGGAGAIEDSFDIIYTKRDELGLEIGPLIARLYGHNFLAVQLDSELNIKPACQTRIQYDSRLPTVLIHYMGGGLDFGNTNFHESGHYEVIIRTSMAGLNTSRPVEINEMRTSYIASHAEATLLLDLFDAECGHRRSSSSRRSTRRSSSGKRSTRKVSSKKNTA
jgi:hypothetical protein